MNAAASGTVRDRRTAVIEAAVDIECPAEVVFGYCSDHTNEIEWNPDMRRVAKITDGPIGYLDLSRRLGLPVGSIGPTRQRAISRLRLDPRIAEMSSEISDIHLQARSA